MSTTLIIILGAAVLLVLIIIGIYNSLIRKRNEVENAFGGMDVQLKKRYDLIPNIVATVKEYAKHEKDLLETFDHLDEDVDEFSNGTLLEIFDKDGKIRYSLMFFDPQ